MSTAIEARPGPTTLRQRAAERLPTGLALLLIAAVWVCGAVWSFEEQTHLARALGFQTPELLPLTLDGMAVAMAAVAWAASLDARPAVYARLITAVAIGASAASNASAAWRRANGDAQTVIIAAGVAVAAMFAFEVLLGEMRRQVLRRRGQPGPVAITYPRLVRLFLAPWPTFTTWRRLVLKATDPARDFGAQPPLHVEATVDESDPGIQLCRQLQREMAATAQTLSPQVARIALADAMTHWSAVADRPLQAARPAPAVAAPPAQRELPPAPPSEPRPTQPAPASEPAEAPPAESPRESTSDSPRPAVAAHAPTQRRLTERLTTDSSRADDRKLRAAHARLTKRLDREPSGAELAEATGVSKATANRWKSNRAKAQKES